METSGFSSDSFPQSCFLFCFHSLRSACLVCSQRSFVARLAPSLNRVNRAHLIHRLTRGAIDTLVVFAVVSLKVTLGAVEAWLALAPEGIHQVDTAALAALNTVAIINVDLAKVAIVSDVARATKACTCIMSTCSSYSFKFSDPRKSERSTNKCIQNKKQTHKKTY